MNDILYRYLQEQWMECNVPKYYHYFDEWVKNLTEIQIYYFNKLWVKL